VFAGKGREAGGGRPAACLHGRSLQELLVLAEEHHGGFAWCEQGCGTAPGSAKTTGVLTRF